MPERPVRCSRPRSGLGFTRTLGVEWRPGRHVPEIAGIPQGLLDVFSKRRIEIEAWLEATGGPTDEAGQQAAVLATRPAASWNGKASHSTQAGRPKPWRPAGARWTAEALAARWRPRDPVGINEVWRLGAVGFDEEKRAVDYEQIVTPEEWTAELLRKDLTVRSTTFTDTSVAEAVARRLGKTFTVTTIERITALVLADPGGLVTVASEDGRRWFTSREVHDVEERFVDAVKSDPGRSKDRPSLRQQQQSRRDLRWEWTKPQRSPSWAARPRR